jgi:hypothetical protein
VPPVLVLVGALSVYSPGDGHNAGALACGGRLTWASHHVALREWRGRCGQRARVCAYATRRCVWTTVQDSGPWGEACGAPGRPGGIWRGQTRTLRASAGCRRRAVVDLTWALWVALGRPPFLSRVEVRVEGRAGGEV